MYIFFCFNVIAFEPVWKRRQFLWSVCNEFHHVTSFFFFGLQILPARKTASKTPTLFILNQIFNKIFNTILCKVEQAEGKTNRNTKQCLERRTPLTAHRSTCGLFGILKTSMNDMGTLSYLSCSTLLMLSN
jgi:hypothetical protein